jgi:hypothetical protein
MLGLCSYLGQSNTIQSNDRWCDNQGNRIESSRSRVRTSIGGVVRVFNCGEPDDSRLPAHSENRTTDRAEKGVALARRHLSDRPFPRIRAAEDFSYFTY